MYAFSLLASFAQILNANFGSLVISNYTLWKVLSNINSHLKNCLIILYSFCDAQFCEDFQIYQWNKLRKVMKYTELFYKSNPNLFGISYSG